MKAAKRTKLWADPFPGEKRLVVRPRQDHNRLWSSRRRLFFWSDLVGPTRTHPGLPRPSLAKAGGAELPLRPLFTSNAPAFDESGLAAWGWDF